MVLGLLWALNTVECILIFRLPRRRDLLGCQVLSTSVEKDARPTASPPSDQLLSQMLILIHPTSNSQDNDVTWSSSFNIPFFPLKWVPSLKKLEFQLQKKFATCHAVKHLVPKVQGNDRQKYLAFFMSCCCVLLTQTFVGLWIVILICPLFSPSFLSLVLFSQLPFCFAFHVILELA